MLSAKGPGTCSRYRLTAPAWRCESHSSMATPARTAKMKSGSRRLIGAARGGSVLARARRARGAFAGPRRACARAPSPRREARRVPLEEARQEQLRRGSEAARIAVGAGDEHLAFERADQHARRLMRRHPYRDAALAAALLDERG